MIQNGDFLLWFDARPNRTLNEKIVEAALYFRRKFDQSPTLCLVNPQAVDQPALSVDAPDAIKLTVKPWKSVPVNHFWIGVDKDPAYAQEIFERNARQIREVAA